LGSIGFGESQRLVPGLIIPTHDVVSTNGACSGYQYRPDIPRMVDGRITKFETARGARLSLDVPPRVRQHLGNPDVPLWITEGAVKADAAASRGLVTEVVLRLPAVHAEIIVALMSPSCCFAPGGRERH
jgi:hypothetical protein